MCASTWLPGEGVSYEHCPCDAIATTSPWRPMDPLHRAVPAEHPGTQREHLRLLRRHAARVLHDVCRTASRLHHPRGRRALFARAHTPGERWPPNAGYAQFPPQRLIIVLQIRLDVHLHGRGWQACKAVRWRATDRRYTASPYATATPCAHRGRIGAPVYGDTPDHEAGTERSQSIHVFLVDGQALERSPGLDVW